ncbi:CDPK1_58 [Blepharisma stoltei]|uniref:non-specific serine/threonine protein kinase n=1 Tax=Blepharisma stoltei TaxID=1481888 RepID=A0AAU9KAX5_9CILI|nr:unnamed protein product [Blepharisma stoltei]
MGCCCSSTDLARPIPQPKSLQLLGSQSPTRRSGFIKVTSRNILDYYEIVKEIGVGGFGTVFEVRDKRSGLRRAMKEIPKDNLDEAKFQKMIEEVELVKNMDHPNIMRIYEVIETSRFYYVITELLDGGELFEKLTKQRRFTEKQAAKYLRDIMSALNYCHKQGIVHRDIKPENLVFEFPDDNSNLKVIDFAISHKINQEEKITVINGTLWYMAPEILIDHTYDEKCDIWSAGVILFIMLSGSPPFMGETEAEIISNIKNHYPKLNSQIWFFMTEECKDLLRRMLTINPKERLTAEEVLAHPWINMWERHGIAEVPISKDVLTHLNHFHSHSKLSKSIMLYISYQLFTKKEEQSLTEIFKSIDKNGDGLLSREELIEGYKHLGMSAQVDVDEIMKNCDLDNSGTISFSEFLIAASQWKSIFKKNQLRHAFDEYDSSKDGKLSLDELKKQFPEILDTEWKKLFEEADENRDGQISFEELKNYLLSTIK